MNFTRIGLDRSTPSLWRKEFPPQMDAFWQAVARPGMQARARKAFEEGFQQRSDVERRLGEYVGKFADKVANAPYRSGSERT